MGYALDRCLIVYLTDGSPSNSVRYTTDGFRIFKNAFSNPICFGIEDEEGRRELIITRDEDEESSSLSSSPILDNTRLTSPDVSRELKDPGNLSNMSAVLGLFACYPTTSNVLIAPLFTEEKGVRVKYILNINDMTASDIQPSCASIVFLCHKPCLKFPFF